MSDPRDAIRDAKAENHRLAARLEVRREELAAEVAALERKRKEAAELVAVADDATRPEATAILGELDERLAAKRTELAVAAADQKEALAEITQLDRLAGGAAATQARAIAESALGGDPLIQSLEEGALERARGHIADLDAQVRLNDELAPEPAAAPALKKAMDDEEARRKFEEMRAGLTGGAPKAKKTM